MDNQTPETVPQCDLEGLKRVLLELGIMCWNTGENTVESAIKELTASRQTIGVLKAHAEQIEGIFNATNKANLETIESLESELKRQKLLDDGQEKLIAMCEKANRGLESELKALREGMAALYEWWDKDGSVGGTGVFEDNRHLIEKARGKE